MKNETVKTGMKSGATIGGLVFVVLGIVPGFYFGSYGTLIILQKLMGGAVEPTLFVRAAVVMGIVVGIACAAAVATIQVMRDEKLVENAASIGEVLMAGLKQIRQEHPEIGDVRGLGLMVATEFVTDRRTKEPAVQFRDRVLEEAYHRGLILLPCGRSSLRYIPPLIVQRDEIDEAVEVVDASIRAARARA